MEKTMFREEVYERSQIARSAKYRKGKGGRGVHTRMPSDNMTAAQRAKKNGPVEVYNFNKVMTWKEFKTLDDRLKKEYILKLVNKHGGTAGSIAAMFNIHYATLRKHMDVLKINFTRYPTNKDRKKWERFLKQNAAYVTLTAGAESAGSEEDNSFVEQTPVCDATDASPADLICDVAPATEEMDETVTDTTPIHDDAADDTDPAAENAAVILSGSITLKGNAADCLEKIAALLGTGNCTMTVQWTTQD